MELVLAVQSLMYEKFGSSANDLADGDSGVEGRGVRRRRVDTGNGAGKNKRKRKNIVNYLGWEWDANEMWDIECLIGKVFEPSEATRLEPSVNNLTPSPFVLYRWWLRKTWRSPGDRA